MTRTAADIMDTGFRFVDCDTTVAEAEDYLEQDGVAALPVLNPDRTVFGLLTPKNVLHFYRRPLNNPRAFHAWEICDARPLLATADSSLDDMTAALTESSAPCLLVVNPERQIIGVISAEILLQQHAAHALSEPLPPVRPQDRRRLS